MKCVKSKILNRIVGIATITCIIAIGINCYLIKAFLDILGNI